MYGSPSLRLIGLKTHLQDTRERTKLSFDLHALTPQHTIIKNVFQGPNTPQLAFLAEVFPSVCYEGRQEPHCGRPQNLGGWILPGSLVSASRVAGNGRPLFSSSASIARCRSKGGRVKAATALRLTLAGPKGHFLGV